MLCQLHELTGRSKRIYKYTTTADKTMLHYSTTTLKLAGSWGSWVLHINGFCALHINVCCTSTAHKQSPSRYIPEAAHPQSCSGPNIPSCTQL